MKIFQITKNAAKDWLGRTIQAESLDDARKAFVEMNPALAGAKIERKPGKAVLSAREIRSRQYRGNEETERMESELWIEANRH